MIENKCSSVSEGACEARFGECKQGTSACIVCWRSWPKQNEVPVSKGLQVVQVTWRKKSLSKVNGGAFVDFLFWGDWERRVYWEQFAANACALHSKTEMLNSVEDHCTTMSGVLSAQ